jgi:hypothetical protein
MTKILINAAMVPNPGTFSYQNISQCEAVSWLKEHGHKAASYIGYPQTADHINKLSGVHVMLNRAKCSMTTGDEALVVKLAYRVVDPATKGQPQPEDWEYGLLQCLED